jgi:hypothetical protein
MTKVVKAPGGGVSGSTVTRLSGAAERSIVLQRSGETESSHVLAKWIRSRAEKQQEPTGQHCTGCRSTIAGDTDDELRASGGTFLTGAGWFCGPRCERQYRLRFRIQPSGSQAAALTPRTPTPRPPSLAADPPETSAPARRSAADELAEALRARKRSSSGG